MNVFYMTYDKPSGVLAVEKSERRGGFKHVEDLQVTAFPGGNRQPGVGAAVYDWTQTSDDIKSGDLVFVDPGNKKKIAVVVLDGAWPVQLAGPLLDELHTFVFDPRYQR